MHLSQPNNQPSICGWFMQLISGVFGDCWLFGWDDVQMTRYGLLWGHICFASWRVGRGRYWQTPRGLGEFQGKHGKKYQVHGQKTSKNHGLHWFPLDVPWKIQAKSAKTISPEGQSFCSKTFLILPGLMPFPRIAGAFWQIRSLDVAQTCTQLLSDSPDFVEFTHNI